MRAIFLLTMLLGAATCTKTPSETATPADLALMPAQHGDKWVEHQTGDLRKIIIAAEAEVEGPGGIKAQPRFFIGCAAGFFAMGLDVDFPLEENKMTAGNGDPLPNVKIRYDNDEIQTEAWLSSKEGLMKPILNKNGLGSVLLAELVRVQFKPLGAPSVVARFDTDGLAAHAGFLRNCPKR